MYVKSQRKPDYAKFGLKNFGYIRMFLLVHKSPVNLESFKLGGKRVKFILRENNI
jgi:hypothetical protein